MTRVGSRVQVTAKNGLRARTAAGQQVKTKAGKAVIRPAGFRFKARARRKINGQWYLQAKTHWYAAQYLKKAAPVAQALKAAAARVVTPVPGYRVTTPWRKKPNNNTYWRARGYHTGDDYAAPTGAKVVAVRAGTARHYWDSVLGTIVLLYADNNTTYWYCHLSARSVTNGARVKPGQVLGKVGATGTGANGPHLHLERRSGHTTNWGGADINPREW